MSVGNSTTFDWGEYIDIANQLSTSPPSTSNVEGVKRVSISRAYYGAFGLLKELAINNSWLATVNKTGKIHDDVIRTFTSSDDPQKQKIGYKLDRLRKLRNKADYKCVYPNNLDKDTKKSLKTAKQIKQFISELISE